MIIREMKTNHLTNPLGFSMEKPLFTWIADESTGKHQKAARIQIASDDAFIDIVFDSGLKSDISSLGYSADFVTKPYTRYFWRVEVVADDEDRVISAPAWFETAKQEDAWTGKWIQAPFDKDIQPILAKTFSLSEKPVAARLYATCLGVYEFNVNGTKAGSEVLAPFYNDYNLWLQYQTYDVTDLLDAGENRMDCWLGNGWYKGRFGYIENLTNLYGDQLKMLAELRLTFADGSVQIIGSDESWLVRKSPVLESSIYDGEVYDARLFTQDLSDSVPAAAAEAPSCPLVARLSPPLCIVDHIAPAKLIRTPKDETVIDFGQLMTGWIEFNVDIPAGEKVFMQFGELLQNDCFYNENLRSAKEEYTYISDGKPAHVRPHFTFYGFRFVKITGLSTINLSDFDGCVIHSDLPVTGHLKTSNPKVNQLIHNAFWGQIGNFLDVPTDCPQRDERMGWTGDAHVFAPTASFNMYTPAFYNKYLYDMRLEQEKLDGSVPHVVPDILNQISMSVLKQAAPTNQGSCAWGDAAIGIPWTMYTFYGDKEMLRRQYANMKMWTDWIIRQDNEKCGGRRLWTSGFHFADWLALDNPDKESCFGGTDPYFIASAFYYNAANTMAKAAEALSYEEDFRYYAGLAEEIREAFRKEYFTETGRIAEPTQTAMTMALFMDLVPEEYRERLRADLRRKIASRKEHLDTGFVGTYYLCRTLTLNGMQDVAYTLLLNEDFPSWLYEVNMGATTIWERWNSVLPNGLVSDTGMNSMNHYAYGSVVEWMYRCMSGLNPVENTPGFKKARIMPFTDSRFETVSASYDSASGLYESSWERTEKGVTYNITIPFDCEAEFIPECRTGDWVCDEVPFEDSVSLGSGKHTILYTKK